MENLSVARASLSRVGGTRVRLTGGGVRTWPTKTKSIKHVTFSAVSTDADALRPFRPLWKRYACAVDVAVVDHLSPDDRRKRYRRRRGRHDVERRTLDALYPICLGLLVIFVDS